MHFGITQMLTTKITKFEKPVHFRDEQIKGIFKFMQHDHYFKEVKGYTLMTDHFNFIAPLGILGKLAQYIFVKSYLKNLLIKRNETIKEFAEGDQWKKVLPQVISL